MLVHYHAHAADLQIAASTVLLPSLHMHADSVIATPTPEHFTLEFYTSLLVMNPVALD